MAEKRSLIARVLARARRRLGAADSKQYISYSARLPDGFGAGKIAIELSVPQLPAGPMFSFSDHVVDENGGMTNTVLAATTGGFAISNDLGDTWRHVQVKSRRRQRFFHLRAIGNGEILAQVLPSGGAEKDAMLDLLVLNEAGEILAEHPAHSLRWHGCRSVDIRGGTLMYAEYPNNKPRNGRRPHAPRVLRSRDRGRSWETAFSQTGEQVRHFHFLQARPGHPREWWLASGDYAHECHVWRSLDDGDAWIDLTAEMPARFDVGGKPFTHSVFRLTDLFWLNDEIVWGTDDFLPGSHPQGARIFASRIANPLVPREAGLGHRHFRSVIDLGEYLLFVSQRARDEDSALQDTKPGVYLMPKRAGETAIHLFDLACEAKADSAGFTFSKASRAAVNGTFFSFRSSQDVFSSGNQILEWKVTLE